MCLKIIIQNVKWEKLRTSLVRFIIYSRDNDAIWWFQNNEGENSWELLVLLEENEASAFDTLKMKTQEKDLSLAVSRFWCLSCIPECICLSSAANSLVLVQIGSFSFTAVTDFPCFQRWLWKSPTEGSATCYIRCVCKHRKSAADCENKEGKKACLLVVKFTSLVCCRDDIF